MLWIGIGGIIGSLARYYTGKWISSIGKSRFPWGTWAINLAGSFCFGWLFALHSSDLLPTWLWLAAGPGIAARSAHFQPSVMKRCICWKTTEKDRPCYGIL